MIEPLIVIAREELALAAGQWIAERGGVAVWVDTVTRKGLFYSPALDFEGHPHPAPNWKCGETAELIIDSIEDITVENRLVIHKFRFGYDFKLKYVKRLNKAAEKRLAYWMLEYRDRYYGKRMGWEVVEEEFFDRVAIYVVLGEEKLKDFLARRKQ